MSWFSKRQKESADDEIQKTFSAIRKDLKGLRGATEKDFPKLNASHRSVQQLAVSIARLPNGDKKATFTKELRTLHGDLNKATEGIMKGFGEPMAETDNSLFQGLQIGSQPPVKTLVPVTDFFNGTAREKLNVTEKASRVPEKLPAQTKPNQMPAQPDSPASLLGGPLPEDMFSNLGQASRSASPSNGFADMEVMAVGAPSSSRASDPFALPTQQASSQSMPMSPQPPQDSNPGGTAKVKKRSTRKIGLGRQDQLQQPSAVRADFSQPQAELDLLGGFENTLEVSDMTQQQLMPLVDAALGQQAKSDPFIQDSLQTNSWQEGLSRSLHDYRRSLQKRRNILQEIWSLKGAIKKLKKEEEEAVEKEDFKTAGDRRSAIDRDINKGKTLETKLQAAEQDILDQVKRKWKLIEQHVQHLAEVVEEQRKISQTSKASTDDHTSQASQLRAQAERLEQKAHEKKAEQDLRLADREAAAKASQEELQAAIQTAAGPLTQQREAEESAASVLQSEIEALRRQLQEKENALEIIKDKLKTLDDKIADSKSQFDGQRTANARVEEEIENEKIAAETALQAQLSEAANLTKLAAIQEQAKREAQIQMDAAQKRIEDNELEMQQLLEQMDLEQRTTEKQQSLRVNVDTASRELQSAALSLEDVKKEVATLAAEWTEVKENVSYLEGKIAHAQKRLPEIEAEKKRAALRKDFQAAMKLSEEAKELTNNLDYQRQELGRLQSKQQGLQAGQDQLAEALSLKQEAVNGHENAVTAAQLALLKAELQSQKAQHAAAVKAGADSEAESIQAEIKHISEDIVSLESGPHQSGAENADNGFGEHVKEDLAISSSDIGFSENVKEHLAVASTAHEMSSISQDQDIQQDTTSHLTMDRTGASSQAQLQTENDGAVFRDNRTESSATLPNLDDLENLITVQHPSQDFENKAPSNIGAELAADSESEHVDRSNVNSAKQEFKSNESSKENNLFAGLSFG